MHCIRKVTDDIYWVGGNDKRLELFENIHPLPDGVSYNSYVMLDEKTVLFDTADWDIGRLFLSNVEAALDGRALDVLVVNHLEPDHASTLNEIVRRWPDVQIYCTVMAERMMKQYCYETTDNVHAVGEGDKLEIGSRTLTFYTAPMVHWPEVMVTFDDKSGALFSADAFGTFGSLDGALFADEVDLDGGWMAEARRYYGNICGKYGPQVQMLLGKLKSLGDSVKFICPLHGPVWRKNFDVIEEKYDKWSKYEPEVNGVVIVYGSMYGNTEGAAQLLASELVQQGVTDVRMFDVSKTNVSYLISEVFKYSHIALLSVTYNMGLFPPMRAFVEDMQALNISNRKVMIVENGTWAPQASGIMTGILDEMQNMEYVTEKLTIMSSPDEDDSGAIVKAADTLAQSVKEQ